MASASIEVDLVYLWVDGTDPKWQEKKRIFTGKLNDNSEENNKGRYISNDELKYSLRSVEKHAPWIRKIFIVTDNQKPEWLNTSHPKIQVVDHQEIIPAEILPCFNSSVIEYFLYKIPGLADRFLFSNDDMFFNADVEPGFFFASDGFPIVRLKRKPLGKWHHRFKLLTGKGLGQYMGKVVEGALTVEKKYGIYYSGVPHHNIDSYKKSDYQEAVEKVFEEQAKKSQTHRIRTVGDLHRSAFGYYILAIKHGHLKYVDKSESVRLLPYRHDLKKYLQRYSPKLFCLNDNERVTDVHRLKFKPFLEELFSSKSAYEKP